MATNRLGTGKYCDGEMAKKSWLNLQMKVSKSEVFVFFVERFRWRSARFESTDRPWWWENFGSKTNLDAISCHFFPCRGRSVVRSTVYSFLGHGYHTERRGGRRLPLLLRTLPLPVLIPTLCWRQGLLVLLGRFLQLLVLGEDATLLVGH